MGCSCTKRKSEKPKTTEYHMEPSLEKAMEINRAVAEEQDRIKPLEQCCMCASKHYAEALCLLTEYGYEMENRALIQGNLRLIVRHTYKEWKDIASLSRECALLIQEARDDEAIEKMKTLGEMIENAVYDVNPEIKDRIEQLKSRHIQESQQDKKGV